MFDQNVEWETGTVICGSPDACDRRCVVGLGEFREIAKWRLKLSSQRIFAHIPPVRTIRPHEAIVEITCLSARGKLGLFIALHLFTALV
jgi:hypothetical protein